MAHSDEGFDGAAAVTRSLLGYGMVAGVFYLAVGVTLGLARDGFVFSQHPLSLLMLGGAGWMQRVNILVTAAMVGAAVVGSFRALSSTLSRRAGVLLGVYALALAVSAIFPPDPVDGFPVGSTADATAAGMIHLVAGGIAFIALAAAAWAIAGWAATRQDHRTELSSRVAAVLIVAGFIGGALLSTSIGGVMLLWLAVVVGWAWLAFASLQIYRIVPHPDIHRRRSTA